MSEKINETKIRNNKKTLFYNLESYLNTEIICFLSNGKSIYVKLITYDEATNCILNVNNTKNILVLGKSIIMICQN